MGISTFGTPSAQAQSTPSAHTPGKKGAKGKKRAGARASGPANATDESSGAGASAGAAATGSSDGSAAAGAGAAGIAAGASGAKTAAGAGDGGDASTPMSDANASAKDKDEKDADDAGATKNAIESSLPRDDPSSPFEKPDTVYQFVGARFRYVIIPKFMMSLFGDGGTTVGVPAFGPEFSIRKNGFEYTFSVMYALYNMDPTPFKSKTDPPEAWEIVNANIKALYLSSDFMWSAEIDPKFAFEYGAGVGLGLVFGDIHRYQAYPPGGTTDPYQYQACTRPGVPNGAYCGNDNAHYPAYPGHDDYTEPSWANGGSKPIVFPWLSLNTGLRFKPSHDLVTRLEVGWNLFNGPFFGLAGNYGL